MIRALHPLISITVRGAARSSSRAAIFSRQQLILKQPRNFVSTIGSSLCGRSRDLPEPDVMSKVDSQDGSQTTGTVELGEDGEGKNGDVSEKLDEESKRCGLNESSTDIVSDKEDSGQAKVGGEVEGKEKEVATEGHKEKDGGEVATGSVEVEESEPKKAVDKTPPTEEDKSPPPLDRDDKTPPPEEEEDGNSSTDRAAASQKSTLKHHPTEKQGGFGGFLSSQMTSMKRWFSQEPKRDRQYWESLSLDEKRKYYKCGHNFVALEDIMTWEEFRNKMKPSKKRPAPSVYPHVPLLNQKVSLWQGDITTLEIDAIVNAANSSLLGGGGVDGAIHRAASSSLRDECATLNGCHSGDAKITSGHRLPAKYILHTVGPMNASERTLRSCYERCLELSLENGVRSVAFSCIATGVYGYPNEAAAHVALETARQWLEKHADKVDRIIFCVFLNLDLNIYSKLLAHYFPTEDGGEGEGDLKDEGTPADKKENKDKDEDEFVIINIDEQPAVPTLERSIAVPPTSGKEGDTKQQSGKGVEILQEVKEEEIIFPSEVVYQQNNHIQILSQPLRVADSPEREIHLEQQLRQNELQLASFQTLQGQLPQSQLHCVVQRSDRELEKQVENEKARADAIEQRLKLEKERMEKLQEEKDGEINRLSEVVHQQENCINEQEQRIAESRKREVRLEQQLHQNELQLEQRVAESREREVRLEQQLRQNELQLANSDRVFQDIFQRLLGQLPQSQPHWVVRRGEIELTEEQLGVGGWATVKVALFRGQRVAAKCLHNQIISAHNIRLFTREMNMAARSRHPNLLQFIGATMDNNPIILTELMPTSLRRILEEGNPLSHRQIVSIASDVARALNYLHLTTPDPIIHRDVSSANVLLKHSSGDSYEAKLSDYGSANFVRYSTTVGPGNPLYSAPEVNDPKQHSPKMDVYSFGVLLVEMCSGELFDDIEELIHTRVREWPEIVEVIRSCTRQDPQRRPNTADVITQLELMR